MLAGKGGWGKGFYGPFGLYGGCVDRVLKSSFLLSNLINYNYFLRKSICINTSPRYQGPQCFLCVLVCC